MSKNKKQSFGGLVFSTNPDFQLPDSDDPTPEPGMDKQVLRVWLERGRGGKESTVVKGFVGPEDRLEELAKLIKNKCAAGGSAKDGIIIVQGDHRDKVLQLLLAQGYKNVKKAGG